MNETLQEQLYHLFGTPMLTHTHKQSLYALPNGNTTSDREEARNAWEMYQLQRNVQKCNTAGKLKYCAGRL